GLPTYGGAWAALRRSASHADDVGMVSRRRRSGFRRRAPRRDGRPFRGSDDTKPDRWGGENRPALRIVASGHRRQGLPTYGGAWAALRRSASHADDVGMVS